MSAQCLKVKKPSDGQIKSLEQLQISNPLKIHLMEQYCLSSKISLTKAYADCLLHERLSEIFTGIEISSVSRYLT